MIRIEIPGEPISKARHRLFRRGSKNMMYDPQNAKKQHLKTYIKAYMKKHGINILHRTMSCSVKFQFYFSIPGNLTKKLRNYYMWGKRNHLINKDIDNCEKFYLDVGNKILYHDDKQITTLQSLKSYSINPRTVIELIPHDELKDKRLEEVLGIYSPLDIEDLITKIETIKNFYNMKTSDENGVPSIMQQESIAYYLLELAVKHSDKLKKIEKLK